MTMTAFQLEDVELTQTVRDVSFAQKLNEAKDYPARVADRYGADPRVMLRGPDGAQNQAVLHRLVAEITGGATLSAEEFGHRASDWLQKRHAYALSVKLPKGEGKDDIVRWLDSNEPGFCEYFAAGFTVLARSAGYPARVVAGFRGGVLNGFENYFMVKNSNAHAWTEIYDGKSAWLRMDPTPGSLAFNEKITSLAVQQAQDSSWSARLDSLRVLWYRRIVSFDSRTQVQMIEQVKTFTSDSGTSAARALRGVVQGVQGMVPAAVGRRARRAVRRAGRRCCGAAVGAGPAVALGGGCAGRSGGTRRNSTRCGARRDDGWSRIAPADGVTGNRERRISEIISVRADLQRLRYGRRETWPEPRGVFRRARKARRVTSR